MKLQALFLLAVLTIGLCVPLTEARSMKDVRAAAVSVKSKTIVASGPINPYAIAIQSRAMPVGAIGVKGIIKNPVKIGSDPYAAPKKDERPNRNYVRPPIVKPLSISYRLGDKFAKR